MQFCLAAYATGGSTCILGVINNEAIARKIGLPENEKMAAIIVYGYEEGRGSQTLVSTAHVPASVEMREQLYPKLRKLLEGLSQQEAANRLLNWVQTGFMPQASEWSCCGRSYLIGESLRTVGIIGHIGGRTTIAVQHPDCFPFFSYF